MIKPRQHSYSIVKVLNSASEMKIIQYVTDLWTMNITFYKEKLNPLSSLMTGATYWCKKQTAIVLVSDRQRNAASQKLSKPMILARYFIHVWIGVPSPRGDCWTSMCLIRVSRKKMNLTQYVQFLFFAGTEKS